ncbi:MAG: hypothetical protein RBR65_00840 [Aliarcobacter sp.]|jgi:nitrogen fixation-related uncharacterized protein|nr:hypothetical protein [Aliarcobacter sp.]
MEENFIKFNGIEVEIFTLLMNHIPLIFIVLFIIGISYKFYTILVSVLSYPTYIALYLLEYFLDQGYLKNKSFYRINIPKDIKKKIRFNTIMSIFTLINIFIVYNYKENYLNIIEGTNEKVIFLIFLSIFICFLFLIVIYFFNWHLSKGQEIDKKDSLEKIVDLNIPSLWKSIIKQD